MGFDMGIDWEDVDDEEPEPIFPYEAEGSPYPPPPVSPDTKLMADIAGFQALRVAQEIARVENIRLRKELEEAQISNTLMSMSRDRAKRDLFHLGVGPYRYHEEAVVARVVGVKPSKAIDVLAVYGEIIPPKMMKRKAVKKMVKKQIEEAIEEYEKTKANQGNAEGVVGLRHWIEKIEQVFEICKCSKEDKLMFAASTIKGRVLTWWNGNVHTLGLVNANRVPWTEFKSMMTTEYCPATKIQMMEQELWTLTLKGNGIETYNNRFHELALMCPDLVPTD
ncbi:putative reverse transcriptase domain-containing protein [Tanacetum coccineum]